MKGTTRLNSQSRLPHDTWHLIDNQINLICIFLWSVFLRLQKTERRRSLFSLVGNTCSPPQLKFNHSTRPQHILHFLLFHCRRPNWIFSTPHVYAKSLLLRLVLGSKIHCVHLCHRNSLIWSQWPRWTTFSVIQHIKKYSWSKLRNTVDQGCVGERCVWRSDHNPTSAYQQKYDWWTEKYRWSKVRNTVN